MAGLSLIIAATTDGANVAADQAKLATDSTQQTTDDAALQQYLQSSGPLGQLSADGTTVTVYAYSQAAPGYTTSTVTIAS